MTKADKVTQRFMLYIVQDPRYRGSNAPDGMTKIGEHVVNNATLADAEKSVLKYNRDRSLFKRAGKYFDAHLGKDILVKSYDITPLAKATPAKSDTAVIDPTTGETYTHRNYKGSKMDDLLRDTIPALYKSLSKAEKNELDRVGNEYHNLSFEDACAAVEAALDAEDGEDKPNFTPTAWQEEGAYTILNAFLEDKKVVFAEFAARYGKTLTALMIAELLFKVRDTKLVIVASYVKTVFASFQKEARKFAEFDNMKVVDAGNKNYQAEVEAGLAEGKQVVVMLSMANSTKRQDKIDYLTGLDVKKMLVVDEADFGVYRPKQSRPLIAKLGDLDHVLLMTGTNADRAVAEWPVDEYTSTTYEEMMLHAEEIREAEAAAATELAA